ncbi:hypothetical protein S7711_01296 [Stachybotrys chartarum IBT 7711]|uniref:Glutathione hydrolase n=1 Tax=Stachybotrys chartarum (strain CBS 109288 / IBT 7711) TaxID=1280523 RepID=A0A084BBL8_STACB|nr:hypothetical protein S7711_01296 [Stachybotrys chartarum IBT 7711]
MFTLTVVTLLALAGASLSVSLSYGSFIGSMYEAKRGAVASMDARCSKAGLEMLRRGGNAADAAIATEFCLGVIGMHLTGIGGGGVMLIRDTNGRYELLDFRETAPAASTEDMFANNVNASLFGGLASGVPGEVRGLEVLHKKYGSLPWPQLLEPAINFARNGFTIGRDLAGHIGRLSADGPFLEPSWAIDFAPNGTVLGLGDVLKRSRYADTLQIISDQGPAAFHSGHIAETIIQALRVKKGIMTLQDLSSYEVAERKPCTITYGEYRVHGSGAPFGGVVALNIMNIMKGYENIGARSKLNLTTHRLDEAMRFGYGLRTKLGDPDYDEGLEKFQHRMLSEATASDIRSRISDETSQPLSAYNPEGLEVMDTPGTSHLSVADASGMAISLTSTINLLFGSYIMVPETGIIMNNEMNDFSIPRNTDLFGDRPSSVNYIKPGKRPLSSMNPVIVEFAGNSTLYALLGAAGSSRIITSVIQGLWNILDRNMSIYDALRAPRFHEQLSPNQTSYEWEYDNGTVSFMEKRGHITGWLQDGSSIQAVRRLTNGTFEAVGEPRQQDSGGFAT